MPHNQRSAALALIFGGLAVTPAAAQDSAVDSSVEVVPEDVADLTQWDYDMLYSNGWRAEDMIGTDVVGPEGDEFGEVENIIVGTEGRIESIIVEAGGFLDMGDTHLSVPWDQVEIAAGLDAVTVPVSEDNVDEFTLFETRGPVEGPDTGPREWRVTELIGDYVRLNEGTGYGLVEDAAFNEAGELQAVIVEPDIAYDAAGPFAYPFYGYEAGFDPGLDTYELPYTGDEVAELEPFDYGAIDEGVFDDD